MSRPGGGAARGAGTLAACARAAPQAGARARGGGHGGGGGRERAGGARAATPQAFFRALGSVHPPARADRGDAEKNAASAARVSTGDSRSVACGERRGRSCLTRDGAKTLETTYVLSNFDDKRR